MDVNCEGCAGCCVDWRPVAPVPLDHERSGPRPPLDDTYNLVPLTRDEVRGFLDAGHADALTPRLFRAGDADEAVVVDGHALAAVDGRPVFYVGLRKPPKPVGPFGLDRRWLKTCVFLDPATLQCRIHGDELYPDACQAYPGHNLLLGHETECERVEAAYGGDRLLDDTPPGDLRAPLFGPQALGARVFAHPNPDGLAGVVDRAARGALTAADQAGFVGIAVGSSPGSLAVNEDRAADARERALEADSWVGAASDDWTARAGDLGAPVADADSATPDDLTGEAVEEARGAPPTPGWDAVESGADGADDDGNPEETAERDERDDENGDPDGGG